MKTLDEVISEVQRLAIDAAESRGSYRPTSARHCVLTGKLNAFEKVLELLGELRDEQSLNAGPAFRYRLVAQYQGDGGSGMPILGTRIENVYSSRSAAETAYRTFEESEALPTAELWEERLLRSN